MIQEKRNDNDLKRKDFSEIVLEPYGNNNFTKPQKAQQEADKTSRPGHISRKLTMIVKLIRICILDDSTESESSIMSEEFEDVNGTDGKSVMEGLKSVQCPYEGDDLEFWLTDFELQLTLIEVKSQWLKRLALQRFLPVEVRRNQRSVKTL